MKKMICAGLLAVLLAPSMSTAQPQPPVAKVSEAEATKIALERIPGKVTDVTIEQKLGKNVYVIEIQNKDQGEKDVFVDIKSGEIVGTD
jgi:uncharacterized membrane protein YkoI